MTDELIDQAPAAENNRSEKLCDFIRCVRESRHITLEKIARDTKLNLEYLQAMERGEYASLPADTYVRIYLRSVAKYLQIDPNEIIDRYNRERGVKIETAQERKASTGSLKAISSGSSIRPVSFIIIFVLLIVVFSFFRTGENGDESLPVPAPADTAEVVEAEPAVEEIVSPDTVPAELDTAVVDTLEQETVTDTVQPTVRDSLMHLLIKCDKADCWVHVIRDTTMERVETLRKGQTKLFKATDIFYVSLGNASAVSIFLNNERIGINREDVARFSVNKEGVKLLHLKEWNYFASQVSQPQ